VAAKIMKGDSRKVVIAALAGNAVIALSKFVAAYLSGSIAMLAEGVHSVADSANQALLLVGMGLSMLKDPERYPFGRATERYFWAFVVALVLFFLGGVFAIYEGVHKLSESGPHDPRSQLAPLIVLGLSIVMEGASFRVAFGEFNKGRGQRTFRETLFRAKDPTIPIVLLEDVGALCGLLIAFVAVAFAWAFQSSLADAIGSIFIGILLCCVGSVLVYETHGLIIGEAATPEMRAQARQIVQTTDGVEAVNQLLTLHLGPDTIVLALKVRFKPGSTVEQVERITDDIEERVRREMPAMEKIFVEADGDYREELDPETRRRPSA
jgi:cation diffusion facilitator family transporter